MFGKLLRKRSAERPSGASVPDGCRIYAIGDIHGRFDLLDQLLEQIEADDAGRPQAERHVIFLGDLIDRGPESSRVIARARAYGLQHPSTRYLMGNHEETFLRALRGDLKALGFFTKMGGRETILSYGIANDVYTASDYPELLALIQAQVPQDDIDFLESFEDLIIFGDYAFVHAGVRPGVPLENQKIGDLRWIRNEFLEYAGHHGKLIVHGHSISDNVDIRVNRIGIDTGAFGSGRLTAIGIQGSEHWFLTTDPNLFHAA